MTTNNYSITTYANGKESVTYFDGKEVYIAATGHPRLDKIKDSLRNGTPGVERLFNVQEALNDLLNEVYPGLGFQDGQVVYNGKTAPAALSRLVSQMYDDGNTEGWEPLARFFVRLSNNPSFNSREQLFGFIERHGIHINSDGLMVMYKGVAQRPDGGLQSISSGRAMVNGQEVVGHIPAVAGDVVTMPRTEISDNPAVACHAGLHCGDYSYARGFGSVLITVLVDPADVVSVPNDSHVRKVRVCAYKIQEITQGQHQGMLWNRDSGLGWTAYDSDARWEGEEYDDEDEYETLD